MKTPLLAVLLHERPETFESLEGTLQDLSLETYGAKTWRAAEVLIDHYRPLLVFVDFSIWRKIHTGIVNKAMGTDHTFNPIVVGALPDIEEYVSAMEQGAFNYIAPPFSHESLTLLVHAAAVDASERREAVERALLSFAGRV
jgi:DNA-binding NtrC family response regulator